MDKNKEIEETDHKSDLVAKNNGDDLRYDDAVYKLDGLIQLMVFYGEEDADYEFRNTQVHGIGMILQDILNDLKIAFGDDFYYLAFTGKLDGLIQLIVFYGDGYTISVHEVRAIGKILHDIIGDLKRFEPKTVRGD